MKINLSRAALFAVAAAACCLAADSANAVNYTWTGAGGNNSWFTSTIAPLTSLNFTPSPVTSSTASTDLFFEGSTRPSNTNNATGGFGANSITFNTTTGFTIGGNQLNVGAGGIANNVLFNQTISANLNFVAAQTVTSTAGSQLTFSGQMNGSQNVTKAGGGTLNLNGQYLGSGTLLVTDGIVAMNNQWTGNVTQSGTSYVSIAASPNGQVTGNYTLNSGTLETSGQLLGSFTQNGGNLFIADADAQFTGPNLFTAGTASATFGSGTTLFNGTMDITGGLQNFTNAQVNGLLTASGGTSTGFIFSKGMLLNGGTVDVNDAFINNDAAMNLTSGTFTIAGTSTGTATSNAAVVLGAGVTIGMDFDKNGNSDVLNMNGTPLTYGGTLALNLTSSGSLTTGQQWDLFDFTSQSGDLNGVTLNSAEAAYSGLTFVSATSSSNIFDQRYGGGVWLSTWTADSQRFIFNQADGVLTVVPEPSTFVFAGIGAAMLGWQTWAGRRRKARMKLIEEHTRKLSEQRCLA